VLLGRKKCTDSAKSELRSKVLINLPPEAEEQDRGKRDSKL
jgi:hypothetical protein